MKESKIFTDEIKEWIITHPCSSIVDQWELFEKTFPNKCCQKTFYRYIAKLGKINDFSKRGYPLYTERETTQGVMVKIGIPKQWIRKQKFVYMQNHPDEDLSETSEYIFLDGDKNNFSPDNIERLPLKIKGNFCQVGGVVKGNPELTRLHLVQAKLKFAIYSAGEKTGLVKKNTTGSRFFVEENRKKHQEYIREYRKRAGKKERHCEVARQWYNKIKKNNPEKYEEYLKKQREKSRKYYQKKKQLLAKN